MSRELPVLEIPRVIDNTALDAYMQCPRKYYYSMVLSRRNASNDSPALIYGTAWHSLMEARYKGTPNEDMELVAITHWQGSPKPDDHRTIRRLLAEYENYCDRWGARPEDEDAQTVGYPENPVVEISTNAQPPGLLHPYAGKIDRIIEHHGQLFVEDHKTTSIMGAYYFRQFEVSNQMMGYAFLARAILGVRSVGVRINAHAVYKKDSKFERQVFGYSSDRLDDWAANLNRWFERLDESYRNQSWPMNMQACAGKYGQCVYTGVCSMPPALRDRALELDFVVEPWDPLKAFAEDGATEVQS